MKMSAVEKEIARLCRAMGGKPGTTLRQIAQQQHRRGVRVRVSFERLDRRYQLRWRVRWDEGS